MGQVVNIRSPQTEGDAPATHKPAPDKRRQPGDDYVRGQQVLANAIFHWKNDTSADAREAVRFLMRHLATEFRADDGPLQPRQIDPQSE